MNGGGDTPSSNTEFTLKLVRGDVEIDITPETEMQSGDKIKAIFSQPIVVSGNVAQIMDSQHQGFLFVKDGANLKAVIVFGYVDHEETEYKNAFVSPDIYPMTALMSNYNGEPISEIVFDGRSLDWLPGFVSGNAEVQNVSYPAFTTVILNGIPLLATADGKIIICNYGKKTLDFEKTWPDITPIYWSDGYGGWSVPPDGWVDLPNELFDHWDDIVKPYITGNGYTLWNDMAVANHGLYAIIDGRIMLIIPPNSGWGSQRIYCPPLPNV